MSQEIRCLECRQPDIPSCEFYIMLPGDKAINVYYTPTELEVEVIPAITALERIYAFDKAMNGGLE